MLRAEDTYAGRAMKLGHASGCPKSKESVDAPVSDRPFASLQGHTRMAPTKSLQNIFYPRDHSNPETDVIIGVAYQKGFVVYADEKLTVFLDSNLQFARAGS